MKPLLKNPGKKNITFVNVIIMLSLLLYLLTNMFIFSDQVDMEPLTYCVGTYYIYNVFVPWYFFRFLRCKFSIFFILPFCKMEISATYDYFSMSCLKLGQ